MAKNASAVGSKRRPRAPIELISIAGVPEIREGNDVARLIVGAARNARIVFHNGDIVIVAQKVVSKAEGRLVRLSTIEPSPQASELAAEGRRDPRLVGIIWRELRRIVRDYPVLVLGTHHGV